MMPRYYLKFLGGAAKVNALVGLAPDNHGTTLRGLTKLLPYFPGAEDLLGTATPGLADQVAGSAFLHQAQRGRRHRARRALHRHRHPVRRGGHAVPHPVPDRPGRARTSCSRTCAPVDLSEHVAIGLTDRIAFHEVANALDPAHATPTTCASDD